MKLSCCVVAVLAACVSAPLSAQNPTSADTTGVANARASAVSPSLRPDSSTARARALLGVQPRTSPVPAPVPAGLSKSEALMVVGGAALIIGALIGGDEGQIIMVGGAVIGLIGLWRWLQ